MYLTSVLHYLNFDFKLFHAFIYTLITCLMAVLLFIHLKRVYGIFARTYTCHIYMTCLRSAACYLFVIIITVIYY